MVMLLCKIQMVVSTSTDQSDAVSSCLLYLFVSCLKLEFILCNLSTVSHSRFRGSLKECVMKTAANEGGFPPFPSAERPCSAPAKAGFAALLSLYARLWQSSGKHPSTVVTTTPLLPALTLFVPPKRTCRAMVYTAQLIKFACNPPYPSPAFCV